MAELKQDNHEFQNFVEKVKDANDIVDVISKYVTLNKKGNTWWGNCPFHYEKTPSFAVNGYEQYYHCFGCGVGGDVIKFVQKIESCDFYDAIKILAKNANMEMPVFTTDENVAKLKKEKDRLYEVLRDTANYYYQNLKTPKAQNALKYIEKRKLNMETVKAFGIGASVGWNDVINFLSKKGYTPKEMKDAGVAEEKDGRLIDPYANRLIFPLLNRAGNVIGFSGRLLEDANFAKYKNTAQTIVFDKSRCIYGIQNLKKIKQTEELKEVIIVEGQMDVISLYRNGVKNAIATLGTALTSSHAKELTHYVNKVVVCFDGDGAGKKATLRSLDILFNENLEVYVASMPAGIDPDEYILKYGKEQFEEMIFNAKYWVEYLIDEYAKNYNLDKPNEKANFVTVALNVVKKLKSNSEQNIYLEKIKQITNIAMDILKKDLENVDSAKLVEEERKEKEQAPITIENAYVKAVKFVMAALLHKREYATLNDQIKNNLMNGDYLKIYEYIENSYKENKTPIISAIFNMFDVDENVDVSDIVNYEFVSSEDNGNYFNGCVKTLARKSLEQKQKELSEQHALCKDMDERKKIAYEIQRITIELKKI